MGGNTRKERKRGDLRIGLFGPLLVYHLSFPTLRELCEYSDEELPMVREVMKDSGGERAELASADGVKPGTVTAGRGGTDDGFDRFMQLVGSLETINRRKVHANVAEPSFVGSRPNVPAYVAGAPKNMYRMARPKEKKVIQVFMNLTYSEDTTEAQVRNRGILALNLIRILESNDYIVDFRAFEASVESKAIFLCGVTLKKPGERLNPGRLYYPLCGHPLLRRTLVKLTGSPPRVDPEMSGRKVWGEELQELLFLNRHWKIPVGKDITEEGAVTRKRKEKQRLFLGTPQSLGIQGENIFRDADSFLRSLKLDGMIEVPKYETAEE